MKQYMEPVFDVDYIEFDKLVEKHFCKGWTKAGGFCAVREASNDSVHSFDVNGILNEDDLEDLDQIRNDPVQAGYCSIYALFNWFVKNKHLKPGRYLVDVCW